LSFLSCLSRLRLPPRAPPFPYTTLFRSVRLAGKIGEIIPGARADLLVVDIDTPEFVPSWDVPWELVRLANRDQIEAVIVDGRLRDRKSTRLNSSHVSISYAVFCLKKKKN